MSLSTREPPAVNDIVAHNDVAGKGGIVGKDAFAAHHTVVCNMDVGHEEVVGADDRAPRGGGAAVDGATFAYDVVVADFAGGVFAIEFQILRYGGNDGAGEDMAVFAYPCTGVDDHIGFDDSVVTDNHIFANGGEVAHLYVVAQDGFGVYVV